MKQYVFFVLQAFVQTFVMYLIYIGILVFAPQVELYREEIVRYIRTVGITYFMIRSIDAYKKARAKKNRSC